MRVCTRCSASYENYGQRNSFCRPCKRDYDREYHKKRSQSSRDNKYKAQQKRLVVNKTYVFKYLLDNPCLICNENDPIVLEFDHLDPKDKSYNVSSMVSEGFSLESIKEEISKCRVLCANCHRRETAKQFNWFSL